MIKRITLSLVIVISFVLSACGNSEPAPPPDATPLDVLKFAGHYEGAWTNSKTGATGPATFDFVVDEANKKIALTLDMGGNYLGLGDPPAATIYATYDDYFARITGTDAHFGEMDVLIDGDGNITGEFKNVAGGMVPLLTYTGVVGDGKINTTYVITFPDGTTADAVLVAERK